MAANSATEVAKAAIRREYSLRRRALDADLRRQYDAEICEKIRALPCYMHADCVAGFIRHGAEADLSPLFKGKRLFTRKIKRLHHRFDVSRFLLFLRGKLSPKNLFTTRLPAQLDIKEILIPHHLRKCIRIHIKKLKQLLI